MIEKLRVDGFISSNKDYRDGRRKKLSLTSRGNNLLDEIIPEYNRRINTMSSNLQDQEKDQLISLLSEMNFLDEKKKIRRFP